MLPAYLKKAYRDDPIFSSSKVVLSLYDDTPKVPFHPGFAEKARFGGLAPEDLAVLDDPTGINLAKLAVQYADGVILGAEHVEPEIVAHCKALGLPILPFDRKALEDGSYMDAYCSFYDEL